MRHVVVLRQRHICVADRLEVEGIQHLVEARGPAVIFERTRVELAAQEWRAGQNAGQADKRLAARQAVPPKILNDRPHRSSNRAAPTYYNCARLSGHRMALANRFATARLCHEITKTRSLV